MSGGYFDYKQHHIYTIADKIERYIEKCEKKVSRGYGYEDAEGKYVECVYEESEPVLCEFRKGVKALRVAAVYAHRIDWLLSGDDGEESFLRRLKEDLERL